MPASTKPERPVAPRAFEPVRGQERIVTLDVLRGFAIFGILLVNVPLMLTPVYREALGATPHTGLDRVAARLIEVFAEGKFFTMFSLAFGVGFAIQARRARQRGAAFVPFFLRRMGVLLAIGIVHVLALWWGDILIYYAVLGLLLVPARRAAPGRLLRLAVMAMLVPLVLNAGFLGLARLAQSTPEGAQAWSAGLQRSIAGAEASAERAVEVYRGRDVAAMVGQRVDDWGFATIGITLNGMLFVVLAMFLVGAYVGRRGVLHDVEAHLVLVRRVRLWGALLGALGTLTWLASEPSNALEPTPGGLLSTAGFVVGAPALSLAYAATLTLAARDPRWARRMWPLAAVGRTALSNYLFQSLVVTTLAYGYGFGLYGRVGPAAALGIALLVFAVQVPLSMAWTRRFRFGPVEWAWRTLTYGRIQPLRREGAAPAARPPRS